MTVELTPTKNGRKEEATAKDITREIKGEVPERLWKDKSQSSPAEWRCWREYKDWEEKWQSQNVSHSVIREAAAAGAC